MTTFEQYCKDVKLMLLRFGVGGGQVLSNLELNKLWMDGMSIHSAFDVSTDVTNGFTFEEAFRAAKGYEIEADIAEMQRVNETLLEEVFGSPDTLTIRPSTSAERFNR